MVFLLVYKEAMMSKTKIIGLLVIMVVAFGLTFMDYASAGEKIKCRGFKYMTKWLPVDVGDKEGHALGIIEIMGIHQNLEGKPFCNGWSHRDVAVWDTASGGHGYEEITDKDGDKIYMTFEANKVREDGSEGTWSFPGGTGKYNGITGKGTWISYNVAPMQSYADWEGEYELP
jgi:hypothetical protein